MSRILHISDPHFGTEQAPVAEALVAMAQQAAPDLVILSGDITQRARHSQFTAAADFLRRLEVPALVLPGNHDIPLLNLFARVFAPYAGYRRSFGELENSVERSDLLVLGLNTTRARRHKDGEVSAAQIERVSARLRAASPTQLRIVVTHQPLHVIEASDETNLLHGHAAALRAWSAAGADLVLGGHIHLPYVRSARERVAPLPRHLWVVQAGTALSSRVRRGAPNSVNLIGYDAAQPAQCSVERWDFTAPLGRFGLKEVFELTLDR